MIAEHHPEVAEGGQNPRNSTMITTGAVPVEPSVRMDRFRELE